MNEQEQSDLDQKVLENKKLQAEVERLYKERLEDQISLSGVLTTTLQAVFWGMVFGVGARLVYGGPKISNGIDPDKAMKAMDDRLEVVMDRAYYAGYTSGATERKAK